MSARLSCPAPTTTPTVNNNESPGRTKPTNRPVSAKTIPVNMAYPNQPETTVESSSIRRSGVVSVRRKSSSEWIMLTCSTKSTAIPGHQPVDYVLVLFDFALLDQGAQNAVLQQHLTLAGLLALQLIQDAFTLRGKLGHIAPLLVDDLGDDCLRAGE